jgi:hypothetical protein
MIQNFQFWMIPFLYYNKLYKNYMNESYFFKIKKTFDMIHNPIHKVMEKMT